jgi:hypothetical protein
MRRLLLALLIALAVVAPAGAWTWPADGPVLQPFSFDPDEPKAPGFHRGIDVAGPVGAAVHAPASGLVSFAGTVPGNGRCVTIETADGWSVTLTHLGSIAVTKGASVVEGDGVGTIGPSDEPGVSDPHVHLGLRRTVDEFGYVDPAAVLPSRPSAAAESAPAAASPEATAAAPVGAEQAPVEPGSLVPAAASAAPVPSAASSGAGPSGGDLPPPGSPPPVDVPPAPASSSPAPWEQQPASPPATSSTSVVERVTPVGTAAPHTPAKTHAASAGTPATTAAPQPETATRADLSPAQSSATRPTPRSPLGKAATHVAVAAPAEEPTGVTPNPGNRSESPHASGTRARAAAPSPRSRPKPTRGERPRAAATEPPVAGAGQVAAARVSDAANRGGPHAVGSATIDRSPNASRRRPAVSTLLVALLGLLAVLGAAGGAVRHVRRRPAPRPPRIIGAHVFRAEEDLGGACVAVRRGPQAPGTRRGLRGPVGRLRALPPPPGERRAHGQRDGRARHAGDGRRGSRREVAR